MQHRSWEKQRSCFAGGSCRNWLAASPPRPTPWHRASICLPPYLARHASRVDLCILHCEDNHRQTSSSPRRQSRRLAPLFSTTASFDHVTASVPLISADNRRLISRSSRPFVRSSSFRRCWPSFLASGQIGEQSHYQSTTTTTTAKHATHVGLR